ncbi:MAG: GTPase HflX [Saprospiraceae bacterium]|nr:GTPase HflX [Saprospiraceae bacterium]
MATDWNIGKQKGNGLKRKLENAILVGLIHREFSEEEINEHLDELEFLAHTAGAVTVKRFVQRLDHPDIRTFVGKGKLQEISEYVDSHDIELVIFDEDLSGKQQNNLEKELKIKIVDRSTLILDIFANRAQTAQAKTQVELAQMQYLLPRLRGLWTHLERQRGGIGMRGPGEKEIETDRRIVRDKIAMLKTKLEKIDKQNVTQRKNRGDLIRVALVGYTNAGKSTLMNLLSKSDVFAEDKLFATLDTTVRKVVFERMPFLLSDTVGFIRKLPHHLVESFKSTLDETRESDLILHVIDLSHPQYEDHIQTVESTLRELDCGDKPVIMIFNKIDQYREQYFDQLLDRGTRQDLEDQLMESLSKRYQVPCLFISAKTRENVEQLRQILTEKIRGLYEVRYPYQVKSF